MLFSFYLAVLEVHFFAGLFLREGEIGAFGRGAPGVVGIEKFGLDEHDVATLLLDACFQSDGSGVSGNRSEITGFHL